MYIIKGIQVSVAGLTHKCVSEDVMRAPDMEDRELVKLERGRRRRIHSVSVPEVSLSFLGRFELRNWSKFSTGLVCLETHLRLLHWRHLRIKRRQSNPVPHNSMVHWRKNERYVLIAGDYI
jgi:hypothetical protein